MGPSKRVRTWSGYFSKGFRFKTATSLDANVSTTMNCGVWVKGSVEDGSDDDYYGVLRDIIELKYTGDAAVSNPTVVMFKCDWFDVQKGVGVRVHPQFRIVDVNRRKKYPKYEPFVTARQAEQVYFAPYPRRRKDKQGDWWAVFKTKARNTFDLDLAFQEDEQDVPIEVVERAEMDDITTQPREFDIVVDIGLQNFMPMEEDDEEGDSVEEDEDQEEEDELGEEEDDSEEEDNENDGQSENEENESEDRDD